MGWTIDNPGLGEVFKQTAYRDSLSLVFLHRLVKLLQPLLVLELGTGKGCSTAFMALALPEWASLVTIDGYTREDINSPDLTRANLERCGVLDRVTLIEGNTFDCGDLAGGSPDLVFMDASHVAENLRKEYLSLKKVLLPGHVLVVDDSLYNDIPLFVAEVMREEGYAFCLTLPFHNGVSVMSHRAGLLDTIREAAINSHEFQFKGDQ